MGAKHLYGVRRFKRDFIIVAAGIIIIAVFAKKKM